MGVQFQRRSLTVRVYLHGPEIDCALPGLSGWNTCSFVDNHVSITTIHKWYINNKHTCQIWSGWHNLLRTSRNSMGLPRSISLAWGWTRLNDIEGLLQPGIQRQSFLRQFIGQPLKHVFLRHGESARFLERSERHTHEITHLKTKLESACSCACKHAVAPCAGYNCFRTNNRCVISFDSLFALGTLYVHVLIT